MKRQLKKSKKESEVVNSHSSKGQLTIFMLLGVVMVVSFGLLFFAVSISQEAKLKQESERVLASFIDTYAIKSYVEACLDITGSNTLLQLGSQSRLYTEQGGTTLLGEYLEIEHNNITANVSYGILRTSSNYTYFQNHTGFRVSVPDYPVTEKNFSELNDDLPSPESGGKLYYDGHYGGVFIPSLCSSKGLNNATKSKDSRYRFGSCLITTYDNIDGMKGTSFQEELGIVVSTNLKACINITYLASSYGYNISDSDPIVKIAYTGDNTKFIAEYPITIRLRGGKPITKVYSFEKDIPVRLMKIYNLAFYLAKQDSRDLFFDRSKTNYYCNTNIFKEEFCWDSNIKVKRENLSNNDYVLRLTDAKSLLYGEPYFFQYLIENRIPVLDWIASPFYHSENETIRLTPLGRDPDQEGVNYRFEGWKETYDSWFNEECALTAREYNPTLSFAELVSQCMTLDHNLQPKNWSEQLGYNAYSDKWETSYKTNRSDIGIHNLTLKVVDTSGNIDYQIIKIFVFDLPKAVLNGENQYTGINNNRTSIEDKYYLDSSDSISFSQAILDYEWSAYTTNIIPSEVFSELTNSTEFIIPDNITGTEVNIEDIRTEEFILPGVYNLSLRVITNLMHWGEPDFLEVNITECLPHSDNTPAYPFNNLLISSYPGFNSYSTQLDPFLADHSCCEPNYTFSKSGTPCLNYEEYGPVKKLNEFQLEKLDLYGGYSRNFNLSDITNSVSNDVYARTFEKVCSGTRGNICSGQGTDVFTITSCGDDSSDWIFPDQTERCQGPNYLNIMSTPLACGNFAPGSSFETFFDPGLLWDGICNEVFRESNPTTNYGDTGPYSCQAQCDSGSCSLPVNCECDNNNECDGFTYANLLGGDISLNSCLNGYNYVSCNVDCEYVYDDICRYEPIPGLNDCNANPNCDGISEGSAINNYEYCDSNCQIQNCGNYAVNQGVNPAECYSSCWNDNDAKCAPGYHCVIVVCVENSP